MDMQDFIARWTASQGAERANKDSFLKELAQVLGVPQPAPKTGDRSRDAYVFEADALVPVEGGTVSIGWMDLYKRGCFVLEAKQGSEAGASVLGTARRGTHSWSIAMQGAYGQALNYARTLDEVPPFLIVTDIGHCFDLYATFDGDRLYRPFPDPRRNRIFLSDLSRHVDLFRAIWNDPHSLDPARRKAEVTRDIAQDIAELAASLHEAGHAQEVVAKFLMRCLFTMFAEDVGLLREGMFTRMLEESWCPDPGRFPAEVQALWSAMDRGGVIPGLGPIKRFNGGLFAEPQALPLTAVQLQTLLRAAKRTWEHVEPAIFGTLLERALSKRERHALGAHYTPRAYVERLVRPTLEEPVRRDWDAIRVEARILGQAGRVDEARAVLWAFHKQLRELRVLDPACGTGNFLYVAMETLCRIEGEVLAALAEQGETSLSVVSHVSPAQFLGIEVKPWAREIAELVLWIGHLSWSARTWGQAAVKEPVLQDHGTIECRDAILAWDGVEPVCDEVGQPVTRWDGTTTIKHPVTGQNVPDPAARVADQRYINPRVPAWPDADFVVGNPPYIGAGLMRDALGDGYVQALRAAHRHVPDSADLVMHFWDMAARKVNKDGLVRFGFITTKAITQSFNRRVVEAHLGGEKGLSLVYAIPNHPWPGDKDSAAVRVAMTVAERGEHDGVLETVVAERERPGEATQVDLDRRTGRLHADLRIGANVAGTKRLRSNEGLCSPGVKLHGAGFIVTPAQAESLGLGRIPGLEHHIVPYRNGRDLAQKGRGVMVIDLHGLTAEEVRERFPEVYQWVVDRVKCERDAKVRSGNKDGAGYALQWWLFGKPRPDLRRALAGLPRYLTTIETSKHRWFTFLDAAIRPDNKLINFGLDDAYHLGVLSSRVHVTWALAAGGRLGVGDDPIYNKTTCFDPFPFPVADVAKRARIRDLGERLDAHRKVRLALHPDLTMTALYNVLEAERAGQALDAPQQRIHDAGLVGLLLQLHRELDAAVLTAYGWPCDLDEEGILQRLVALNAQRAAEEARGEVRWLRPAFQQPQAAATGPIALPGLDTARTVPEAGARPWPGTLSDRISQVREALESERRALSVEDVARRFKNARRMDVEAILDSLGALGLVLPLETERGRRWKAV